MARVIAITASTERRPAADQPPVVPKPDSWTFVTASPALAMRCPGREGVSVLPAPPFSTTSPKTPAMKKGNAACARCPLRKLNQVGIRRVPRAYHDENPWHTETGLTPVNERGRPLC